MARSETSSDYDARPTRPAQPIVRDADGRLPHEGAFLAELGGRVRQMRALRAMSRRQLAHRACLSERYIAQIEAGRGNVSIVKLLRIARAFRGE